jgi:tetratricopeptide (TPR) repeat protein
MAEAASGSDEALEIGLELGKLCDERLGDAAQAIEAYRKALEVDPDSREALDAIQRLHLRLGQYEEHVEVLETLLELASDDTERIDIYRTMARAWDQSGENLERAAECHQEILLIDDRELNSYRRLEQYYRKNRDAQAFVDICHRHVFAEEDGAVITQLLCDIAEVYQDDLGDHSRAADALDEILLRDPAELPRDVATLERLLKRCAETAREDAALEITARLAEAEPDPVKRGKHLHAAGVLCRDVEGAADRALDYFHRALASYFSDPEQAVGASCLRTLEAIDAILTAREDWKALERSYLDVIDSLSDRGDVMLLGMLWQNLATVYSSRLNDHEAAARAFERAEQIAMGLTESE